MNIKRYSALYTWSHPLIDVVIAHNDGAVSLAVTWDGLDADMAGPEGCQYQWTVVRQVIEALPVGHWLEFHLWRYHDNGAAQEYLRHLDRAPRKSTFSRVIREAIAEHLGPRMLVNKTVLIIGKLPSTPTARLKRELKRQYATAQALVHLAQEIVHMLPGARIANALEYLNILHQSYDETAPRVHQFDPFMSVAEQVVVVAPQPISGGVRIDKNRKKILYFHFYPDALPGWVLPLASSPLSFHVSQVVLSAETEKALRLSERAHKLTESTLGKRGRERQLAMLSDMQAFQQVVSHNHLSVHRNTFIVSLSLSEGGGSDKSVAQVVQWLNSAGGRVRHDDFIQIPFMRVIQPGQGYRSILWRHDHIKQIAHMAPVQVFRAGSTFLESLRIGFAGQSIAFDYTQQAVAHGFTVAMTGAGKGVDKVATIIETFPFGVDWYVLEMGSTYQWVVEALGGAYTQLDPDHAAVNPLPPRSALIGGLNPLLAAGTLNILAFLLTDGRTDLDFHEAAVGSIALTALYAVQDKPDPGLIDLLETLDSLSFATVEQTQAAQRMSANLHSFFETPEGRLFCRQDNIPLTTGICGVDLKEVDRASPKLLTFYIVFLSLRFLSLAFSNRCPSRVLLDEIHRLVAHAPLVIRRLVSEIARMGRKEAAAIDIVTQGLAEIDLLETEIVNSMPLRSLLYRTDGYDEIARRIGMPKAAVDVWRSFPYPMQLRWRPALRAVGTEYFGVRLTFPQIVMDLADTTPSGLDKKKHIGRTIQDPLARLAAFRDDPSCL